jgi:hypothetical protein
MDPDQLRDLSDQIHSDPAVHPYALLSKNRITKFILNHPKSIIFKPPFYPSAPCHFNRSGGISQRIPDPDSGKPYGDPSADAQDDKEEYHSNRTPVLILVNNDLYYNFYVSLR